jgi:NAD(P)-dependent dehydrogenase (short-subunit alcohol dehydrogenase family)
MADTSIVIGCSSDIGLSICSSLLNRGDQVIGTTRTGSFLTSLDFGSSFQIAACDSTNIDSIHQLFQSVANRRPRHLIYCAGFHRLAPVTPVSSGALEEHLAINFHGAVNCSRVFISGKYSKNEVQRSITIITSIAHKVGEAGLVGYSASKAAVVGAVKCMAIEYAQRNIRVNTVSPGWIMGHRADTVSTKLSDEALSNIKKRYPLGLGTPKDVADAVSFLSSDSAKWITGVDLVVDGGRTCN